MQVTVYAQHDFVDPQQLAGSTAVVIDTFRATSTVTAALENGCAAVIPVAHKEDAFRLRREVPAYREALLGGEVWADYYQSYFAEAAAYVEANGVEVTGARVYAEADDLLRLWENGDVDKIAIDTVLPSKYSAGGTFGWG